MPAETVVLLFDVDGVLVDPLAYRAGIADTMSVLLTEIGLSDAQTFVPNLAEIAYMESRGIHDIWDIVSIAFALVLSNVFCSLQKENKLFALSSQDSVSCLREIRQHIGAVARPDYNSFVQELVPVIVGGSESGSRSGIKHPPHTALALLSDKLSASADILASWKRLFESFLQKTRSVYENYGTRIFQNVILGAGEFESTYGLTSTYTGPALLPGKDRVIISKESVSQLAELRRRIDVKIAVYTARPSYPPADIAQRRGYSPEAEIAVKAAGMQNYPLVGMGMMEWLANRHGERSEDLAKPNTTHCFSALLAAISGANLSATLEKAYALDKTNAPITASDLPQLAGRHVRIFVFEDTISGIRPLFALADKLNASGFSISVTALGIATEINKKETLSSVCNNVFADVNHALNYVLAEQMQFISD